MDRSDYASRVVSSHLERSGLEDLRGTTVMEVGPGDSLYSGVYLAFQGAFSVLVDSDDFADRRDQAYLNVTNQLLPESVKRADFLPNALIEKGQLRYLTQGENSWGQVKSESIDFLFSQAVLEHVPFNQLRKTIAEMYRVLRPGARASHRVDLKDHLGGGLNNLRFSESLWESSAFRNGGFYTNRVRLSSFIGIFEDIGFEIVELKKDEFKKLPLPVEKVNGSVGWTDESDLLVSGFDILMIRPL
jgi:SAM-dependent methyltransferase